MAQRRAYLFLGDSPVSGGYGGTNIGRTAYPTPGDSMLGMQDSRANWLAAHAASTLGLGILAYCWNHIGTGTRAAPVPSIDRYYGLAYGTAQNDCTVIELDHRYPSELFGMSSSLLMKAHGDVIDNPSTASALDFTFTLKHGSTQSLVVPTTGEDLLGSIAAIAAATGTAVDITLNQNHGKTASSTFTVFLGGIPRNLSNSEAADPQLTGKFTATADAVSGAKFRITLPTAWTGKSGQLPGGFAASPKSIITALANPSGNTLRVTLSAPAPSWLSWSTDYREFWISNAAGAVTDVNGHYVQVQKSCAFTAIATANVNVSFTSGTKTIALASGTWATTPVAGQQIIVSGAATGANNKTYTVVSATSTTIVTSESMTTEAAGASVTIQNRNSIDLNFGSVPNVAGYTASSGYALFRDYQHTAFWNEAGRTLSIPRAIDLCATMDTDARTLMSGLGFPTDTVGIDGVFLALGMTGDVNAATGSVEGGIVTGSYRQCIEDICNALKAQLPAKFSAGQVAANVQIVVPIISDDGVPHATDALKNASGYTKTTLLALQNQQRQGVGMVTGARTVEWSDLARRSSDHVSPSSPSEITLGRRCWAALQRAKAGVADQASPPSGTNVMPVVFLLGQSQTVANVPNTATLPFSLFGGVGDPDFDSSWYDATLTTVTRARNCFIVNFLSGTVEEYAPPKNAVTYTYRAINRWPTLVTNYSGGVGVGNVGPEASLILDLRQRFDREGIGRVLLVKVAMVGASIQPLNPSLQPCFDPDSMDLYADVLEGWRIARDWCHDNGFVPDVRAHILDQGEGDASVTGATTYKAALQNLIEQLREDIPGDAAKRAQVPFVIGRVTKHPRMTFTEPEIDAIRDAQTEIAAEVENVGIADQDGLPIQSDDVHVTWEGTIAKGRRLNLALDSTTIASDGAEAGDGASLSSELSGATQYPIVGTVSPEALGDPSEVVTP